MSERTSLVLWLVVVCTQPQILDIGASTRLLDCSFCLHYLYPWIQQSLASCSMLWILQVSMRFLLVSLGNTDTSSWPIRLQYLLQLWSKVLDSQFGLRPHKVDLQFIVSTFPTFQAGRRSLLIGNFSSVKWATPLNQRVWCAHAKVKGYMRTIASSRLWQI